MKIEKLPIKALKPYEKNAKIHTPEQIDQIRKSIEDFGFNDPIAVDENNMVIEGHGRLMALKEMGWTDVECIRLVGLTEEQKRAYILIHNKLTMNTGFDLDILPAELQSIEGIDMSAFGFDLDFDFDFELEPEEEEDVETLIEAAESETAPPKAKLGDVYQLGAHRLMCGDSTSLQDVETLMNGEKAEMAFTDPPWNVNYGAVRDGNPQGYKPRTILNDFMGTEDFKDFMYAAFAALNFAQKDGAMTYVVMSAQEWGNMMLTLAQNNYHWSSTIIWNKDSLVLSRKDYHTKYEPIWYGWKEGTRLCPLEDRKQSDVWDVARPKKSEEHPTMKPVELVVRAINNSSKRGNIVIDLFGGSGTTLIAAEQTGRRCRMMELDPKYVDVIIARWERLTGKQAVLVQEKGENECHSITA